MTSTQQVYHHLVKIMSQECSYALSKPQNKILTEKGMSIFHKLLNSVTANKPVVYNVSVQVWFVCVTTVRKTVSQW